MVVEVGVNLLDFAASVGISVVSITLSIWAIKVNLKDNKLLMSLPQAIRLLSINSKKRSQMWDQLKKRQIGVDE